MQRTKLVPKIAAGLSRRGRNYASLSSAPRFTLGQTSLKSVSTQATESAFGRSNNNNQMMKSFFSSGASSIPDMIKSKIESNKVVVFSKSYCPFCSATKNLFKSLGVDAEVIELDLIPDGHAIQNELKTMTGQRTVPNVFVLGQHMGGNDNVQAAARSGDLQKMLN